VKGQADYERWQTVASRVQCHDCSATQFRCMKARNAEGEKICRYHRQPPLEFNQESRGWFDEIEMPYGDDVYELLEELGLAHKAWDKDRFCERWFVDEQLRAGKWHYAARPREEFFLSTIPLVSAICRSSTNVDMCDRKFQVSYLVKYISGKEEHQVVDVAASKRILKLVSIRRTTRTRK